MPRARRIFQRVLQFHLVYAAVSMIGGVFLLYTYAINGSAILTRDEPPAYGIILVLWATVNTFADLLWVVWLRKAERTTRFPSGGITALYAGMGILSGVFALILAVRGGGNAVSQLFLTGLYALFFGVLRGVSAIIGLQRVREEA